MCGMKLKLLPYEMKQKYNIFNSNWAGLCSKLNHNSFSSIDEEMSIREELIARTEEFVMNELSNGPLFSVEEHKKQLQREYNTDKEIAEYHQQQMYKQQAIINEKAQKILDKENCIPKCPICNSTNLRKITMTTRVVKTATFGTVGMIDDAGKTYKCENCGSKF